MVNRGGGLPFFAHNLCGHNQLAVKPWRGKVIRAPFMNPETLDKTQILGSEYRFGAAVDAELAVYARGVDFYCID